jgi:glutamate dehydrogenase
MVDRLGRGLKVLEKSFGATLSAEENAELKKQAQVFRDGGFTRKLAEQTVMLERLSPALDVVETAARRRTNVNRVAQVFFGLGDALDLKWLRKQVESLKVAGQWHAVSRSNLRDELFSAHNHLVDRVLHSHGRKKDPMAAWMDANQESLKPVLGMLSDMKNNVDMDYPTISVAVRALERLVAETAS